MEAQTYLINGRIFSAHDPALQEALGRIYGTPVRPRCMCVSGGVKMYVSKFKDFVIKRMPESGGEHRPTCPSYEVSPGDSGLGQVLGEAIIERSPDVVELRLDFPLTRRIGRSSVTGEQQLLTEVTVVCKKLSLRGLLHYLWERARFNRWYPRMQGKRSYGVLHKFLLQACEEIETKGLRLSERVFIPEHFVLARAAAITQRRKEALSILSSPDAQLQLKMVIAIGELKEFKATTLGYQLVLKHLPDCAFFLEQRAGERTKRIFETELSAWDSGRVRLVAACLIYAKQEHCYQVDSLTLMMTSAQWIPLDHVCEKDLVDKLVAEERAFIKPLRYEARHTGEFPNFQLLDAGVRPVALDIVSAFLSAAERAAKIKAMGAREPTGWAWDTAQSAAVPDLPLKAINPVARTSCPASAATTSEVIAE